MTMGRVVVSLLVATCISLVIGGDVSMFGPTAKITFKKIEVKVLDDTYFGPWSSEIHDSGDSMSVIMPIKKDLPDTMMIKGTLEFGGNQIGDIDMTFCEAINDESYGKDVVEAGIPKGKFPKKCPIKANNDYVISKYSVSNEKIPPGLPDGVTILDAQIYEPGKDPYVIIHSETQLSHQ